MNGHLDLMNLLLYILFMKVLNFYLQTLSAMRSKGNSLPTGAWDLNLEHRTRNWKSVQLIKVMGTRVYLKIEITVTTFMQPMPILTLPSTKSFLRSNPFRHTHIL